MMRGGVLIEHCLIVETSPLIVSDLASLVISP